MSATNRRRGPNPFAEFLMLIAGVGTLLLINVIFWLGAGFGAAATGREGPHPFPPAMVLELASDDYTWPGTEATVFAVVIGLIVLTVFLACVMAYFAYKRREVLVDRAIPFLAKPKDLRPFTTLGVREACERMDIPGLDPPGVRIGKAVRGRADLWGSWEDMQVDIWGPRTGKTATRAIPNIVAAPGSVLVTSNKRDVLDATRLSRERVGKVWIFDPQGQANEPARFYWDPLSYVGDSIVRAIKMAGRFSSINRPAHARSDAYFEPAAENLIANLLLAASISGETILQVYTWLTRMGDDTPERILRENGHVPSADAVDTVITAPPEQRAGVYGVASQIMSFLIAPGMTEWVTPGSNPDRPAFDYKKFAASDSETLYMMSEETNKMAAPLILTLLTAVAEAAENEAIGAPGGRLPVPMLFVLDEAANVCPWGALPDKYSHFGSRGMVMMTILQSWAQGANAWGDKGMAKLWGAANVRVYGGGAVDTSFLGDLSAASGVFEPLTTSMGYKVTNMWDRSVTRSSRTEPVLDVADLASMPRGRAFVQFSGSPPTLVRTVPWWEGEYADEIRESIKRYDPAAKLAAEAALAAAPVMTPVVLEKTP